MCNPNGKRGDGRRLARSITRESACHSADPPTDAHVEIWVVEPSSHAVLATSFSGTPIASHNGSW